MSEDDKPRDPRAAAHPPWAAPASAPPVAIRARATPGGLPRAHAQPGYEALAGFLESDLQGGRAARERLLEQVARVRGGAVGGLTRRGNAYLLQLGRSGAELRPLLARDEPACRLELATFERVLHAWGDALEA